jgi:hypothetical protein
MPGTRPIKPNTRIDTGGGAEVAGNGTVNSGSEFVGRDNNGVPLKARK